MKLATFSESLFEHEASTHLDPLFNLICYSDGLFLLVPNGFKTKAFRNKVRGSLSADSCIKIDRLFRRLNKDQRIVRVSTLVGDSFCSSVPLNITDINYYFALASFDGFNPPCENECYASQSDKGVEVRQIQELADEETIPSFELIPNTLAINALEDYLKTHIIRYTTKVEIIDKYLGRNIQESGYQFPTTLNIVYNTFLWNLRLYSQFFGTRTPKFIIHTLGDTHSYSILKRRLRSVQYLELNCYGNFPVHDRFLKTDHLATRWGIGFDSLSNAGVVDSAASGISIEKNYFKFKNLLSTLPVIR